MSNNSGLLFLNKTIQNEDYSVFNKYNIREESFVSAIDRQTFKYINEYYDKHRQMPSYAMVVDNVQDFTYIPDITDSYSVLIEGMENRKIAVEFNKYFGSTFEQDKEETNGDIGELISKVTENLNDIKKKYSHIRSIGTDLKSGAESYLNEYELRKEGKSIQTWKSFMPFVNTDTGGYSSGNMYVYFGKSGRGKSTIMLRELIEFAEQGANVLLWSLEMPTYDVMTRLYVMLSAKLQLTKITTENGTMSAGFDTNALRYGHMKEDLKESFDTMLDEINTHLKGNITLRGVDDIDFHKRDAQQLEADIESTQADVVAIDPMYYMDFEKNTSKTAGGDVAETSKRLRRIAGNHDVVVLTVTQSEEKEEKESSEHRELVLPKRSEVMKTKALLQDASTLIALDTDYRQGRGIVGIVKGRHGGEGTHCEITFLANYGLIEQITTSADLFDF